MRHASTDRLVPPMSGRAMPDADGRNGPRVAVVIVSYNSAALLPDCLAHLRTAAVGTDLVSVVLADNDSADRSVETGLSLWPGLVAVRTGANLGYAAAINRGRAAAAAHDVLVVLNPDAALLPGSLAALSTACMREGVAMAVPRILNAQGAVAPSLRRWPSVATAVAESLLGGRRAARLGVGEMVVDPRRYAREGVVEWATGAAVAVNARAGEQLGPWDESFFLYSEETEYMLRARRLGFSVVFVPQAACRHHGGAAHTTPFLWALLMVNKVRLFRRSHGPTETAVFRLALLGGELLRAARGSEAAWSAVVALARPGGSSREQLRRSDAVR